MASPNTRPPLYVLWACIVACILASPPTASSQTSDVDHLYDQARQAQANGDIKTAIAKYEAIIRVDPRLPEAYNNLGSLYFDDQDYSDAIRVLKRGLALKPDMASSAAILGSTYLAIGNLPDARIQFEDAVRENPRDKRSEDLLEQTLIQMKEYKEAVRRLEQRIAHSRADQANGNQDTLYRLGKVYLALSQQDLLKAREANPNSALAHILQGEIYEALGELDKAASEYKTAVDLDSDKPGAHEHLGNIYWVQALWTQAESQFQAELSNDPGNCSARWKAGNSYLKQDEKAGAALPFLQVAVQRCPTLMPAQVDLGHALVLLHQPKEALTHLLVAAKADPSEPSVHFWLAKAYRLQGNQALAQAETTKFSRLTKSQTKKDLGPAEKKQP